MSKLFSIIDIETNGGFGKSGKITEIAIFITDGQKIISEYSTLINPESHIPQFIENLTGISNEMVENAPKFYEIAKEIVEITHDTVFVAHNVNFDYNFIKNEFLQLGYKFQLETLCTLQLSRKFFKGHKSYSLGNICYDLGISIENRHRAYGDARATVELFYKIYKYDFENFGGRHIVGIPIIGINEKLDIQKLKKLPEKFGIYYFFNSDNEIIYTGKSRNIRSSALSFFQSNKNFSIIPKIVDFDYELTGCSLITDLKYTDLKNRYNSKLQGKEKGWGVYHYEDEKGYIKFDISNVKNNDKDYIQVYHSKKNAEAILKQQCLKFEICHKFNKVVEDDCFYCKLNYGKDCCLNEPANIYNNKAINMIDDLCLGLKNIYILLDNCDNNKVGIVSIKDYKYVGFGFIDLDSDFHIEDFDDVIIKSDCRNKNIIYDYLQSNKSYKIIRS